MEKNEEEKEKVEVEEEETQERGAERRQKRGAEKRELREGDKYIIISLVIIYAYVHRGDVPIQRVQERL